MIFNRRTFFFTVRVIFFSNNRTRLCHFNDLNETGTLFAVRATVLRIFIHPISLLPSLFIHNLFHSFALFHSHLPLKTITISLSSRLSHGAAISLIYFGECVMCDDLFVLYEPVNTCNCPNIVAFQFTYENIQSRSVDSHLFAVFVFFSPCRSNWSVCVIYQTLSHQLDLVLCMLSPIGNVRCNVDISRCDICDIFYPYSALARTCTTA